MTFQHFVAAHFPHFDIHKYAVVDPSLAMYYGFPLAKDFAEAYRDEMFRLHQIKNKRIALRRELDSIRRKPEHDKLARKGIMKMFNELYETQQHGGGFPREKKTYKGYRVFFCTSEYETARGKHTYVEMYNALKCVKRYKIHLNVKGSIQHAVTCMLKEGGKNNG